jgi:hypothetical protein
LRGGVLWDETGEVGSAYSQPNTGLPFGRGFIIDRDGNVALPYFGHQPQMAIDVIHAMLGESDVEAGGPGAPGVSSPGADLCQLLSLSPNPSPGRSALWFDARRAGRFLGGVYDPTGRRRGQFELIAPAPGRGAQAVALSDEDGTPLRSGVYFLRLDENSRAGVRVLILR